MRTGTDQSPLSGAIGFVTDVITVALIVIGCYYCSIQETILLPHEYSDLERVAVNEDWIWHN